jgi:uncharacterized repeat protein (TIGR01451 family)
MKNIYVFLALVFAFSTGASTQSYAVNFTGHSEYDMCDSVNYLFNFTAGSGLTVVSFFGDGKSASPVNMGTVAGTSQHQFSSPGIYTIKHVLYQSGVAVDSISFTDTILCHNALVSAFLDLNSNCTRDAGEPVLTTPVDVEIDSAGVKIDTITVMGGAYREMMPGKTYSLRILSLPSGLSVTCPTGGVSTATISYSAATNFSFAMQCGSSSTFDVSLHAVTHVGRHSEMADIVVGNSSCNAQTVTLTANLSPKYAAFQVAYPAPTTRVGNVLTWVLPNVSAFAGYHVVVYYERAGGTSNWLLPGDTVHTSFSVTVNTGDANPANNSVERTDTVISSYDPNYKSVTPSGNISAGTQLEYAIEYENDGNGPALNIHVLDTLSGNLDANTFKIVSSTAPVTNTSMYQAGGSNILRFDMPGINLLDSSHHGQCTGMVIFTIKAKSTLPIGTVITNRAGIYFDDNPVVMTNSAQNQIPIPQGVKPLTQEGLSAYPNPVHDVLTIKASDSYQSAQVMNTMGQVVMEKNLSGKTTMNVSALANGVYYLVLKGVKGTSTQKIVKE